MMVGCQFMSDDYLISLLTMAAGSIRAVITYEGLNEQFFECGLALLQQVEGFLDNALQSPPVALTTAEYVAYHQQVKAWLSDVERHYVLNQAGT